MSRSTPGLLPQPPLRPRWRYRRPLWRTPCPRRNRRPEPCPGPWSPPLLSSSSCWLRWGREQPPGRTEQQTRIYTVLYIPGRTEQQTRIYTVLYIPGRTEQQTRIYTVYIYQAEQSNKLEYIQFIYIPGRTEQQTRIYTVYIHQVEQSNKLEYIQWVKKSVISGAWSINWIFLWNSPEWCFFNIFFIFNYFWYSRWRKNIRISNAKWSKILIDLKM